MRDQDIEHSIRNAVRHATPNMLDELLVEVSPDNGAASTAENVREKPSAETLQPQPRRIRNPWRLALPAAAALVAVAIGFFALNMPSREAVAVVGLDVNPAIELSVDDRERVVSAEAVNDEASTVLEGLQLESADLNTACHAVVGSMLVKGYLRSDANSILVSVRALDEQAGRALEQQVSRNLNDYLENSEVAVAILGQYVQDDSTLERFANEHGISLGKAWLIQRLISVDDAKLSEDSLLKLSTQELILLAQEKALSDGTSLGASDTSSFISKDEASAIACADAGIPEEIALGLHVEFECEDGKITYEVGFHSGGVEYDYSIDATTGTLLSRETERETPPSPTSASTTPDVSRIDDDGDYDDDDASDDVDGDSNGRYDDGGGDDEDDESDDDDDDDDDGDEDDDDDGDEDD